jgi:predicted nucleotide-binding protein
MDNKRLDLAIANAEAIIKSSSASDSPYAAWYKHAELALAAVFGAEWQTIVLWEGYAREPAFSQDVSRLRRAIGYISAARDLAAGVELAPAMTPVGDVAARADVATKPPVPPRILVVHGHDDASKLELKNYLQNTLKLSEPLILHEEPNHGRTVIEKLEQCATQASFAFVLLTPDDTLADQGGVDRRRYRARQNVIFEMGYFLGLFGRKAGRVILLYKGQLDIPSDIAGLVYIDISNGIEAAGEGIRRELAEFI